MASKGPIRFNSNPSRTRYRNKKRGHSAAHNHEAYDGRSLAFDAYFAILDTRKSRSVPTPLPDPAPRLSLCSGAPWAIDHVPSNTAAEHRDR
jgi:hypothetical protein